MVLAGLEGVRVRVEAHVGPGLPALQIIGGVAGQDSAQRVRVALQGLGVRLPGAKVVVSLSPAEAPKGGARLDLPIAVAVLAALGEVPAAALDGLALVGELGLDGTLRPVPGVLPTAAFALRRGLRLALPEVVAAEAALVAPGALVPLADLAELVAVLRGEEAPREPAAITSPDQAAPDAHEPDLADVVGQAEARRALEVAAAGGHHLLLLGPPGCGKSMLARRLPGILPPLDAETALELAAVRSLVSIRVTGPDGGIDRRPPLRAPHHRSSSAALLGGGSGFARPGELSLAHGGALFLDELLEWPRGLLESLREPLEEGVVRVARTRGVAVYPARLQLVCAANPCPCGGGERCECPDERVWAYRAKLSGPLADRMDLAPAVEALRAGDLVGARRGESSERVAERVRAAREVAAARWPAVGRNAQAPVQAVRATAHPAALRLLADAVERGALTGRGHDRALRVARTVADLEEVETVAREHVAEALAHRVALRVVRGRVDSG